MARIRGIEHFAIGARDPKALCDFYANVLGFRVVFRNEKQPPTFFVKPPGGSMIEIMPAADGAKGDARSNADPGLVHVALSVDKLEEAMQRLAGYGISFEGEVKVTGDTRAVFFRDPEGNILHLIERPRPL